MSAANVRILDIKLSRNLKEDTKSSYLPSPLSFYKRACLGKAGPRENCIAYLIPCVAENKIQDSEM